MPKEVADFLEQDRKREQAQDKRDERHLSKSEFETVLSCIGPAVRRPVEDDRAPEASSLKICGTLSRLCGDQDQKLISLRYGSELTMEEIGRLLRQSPKWRSQSG